MEEQKSLFEIEVDDNAGKEMNELSKWTKLFGIIVLCLIAICILFLAFSWNRLDEVITVEAAGETAGLMGVVAVIVIIVAVIAGIMMFFLVRSANRIRRGLHNRDQLEFNDGLADLKTFFVFMGIFSILSLLSNLFNLIPS